MTKQNEAPIKTFGLTQSQWLMWTGQRLNPDTPLYNMVLAFDIHAALEADHFQQAFQELVNRSDALRSVFLEAEGIARQKVLPGLSYTVEVLDWENNENALADFESWLLERSRQLLDLSQCAFDSVLIKIARNRYIWYFNQHHLITDAWACSILYKAMAELYSCSLKGAWEQAPVLPKFQDYIEYERTARLNQENEDIRRYWEKKQVNLPEPPQLYGKSYRAFTSPSRRLSVALGEQRSARLKALAQHREIRHWTEPLSLFNIFATLLYTFLYRVSGQRQLAIGTPAHNRPTRNFKETPGVFMEIFPLSVEVREEDSFLSLLQSVRAQSNEFLRYAQAGAASPELSRSFNVVLNYIPTSFPAFNGARVRPEWVHPGHSDPRHHLRMEVHDFGQDGSFRIDFDFNMEAVPQNRQHEATGHFLKLLDAFLEDPNQKVGQVDILSAPEKAKLFDWGNVQKPTFPVNESILDAFSRQVRQAPRATAAVFGSQSITYQDLDAKSNQLANYLRRMGVAPGSFIGLLMDRSLGLITAILGILKTGSAYLAIDPAIPVQRQLFMLKDAGAPALVTEQCLAESLSDYEGLVVCLDAQWKDIQLEDKETAAQEVKADSPAYVLYTSGSTGVPKGVCCTHLNLMNLLADFENRQPLCSGDRCSWWTSIGFDVSAYEIFSSLAKGGSLYIVPEEARADSGKFVKWLEDNQVQSAYIPPFMLEYIAGWLASGAHRLALRRLLVGVEPIPEKALARIGEQIPGLKVINGYGPTEATVCSTLYDVPNQAQNRITPMGKPVQNTQALVLDAGGQLLPAGVPGELHIGGMGLAKGYLNRPELTEEQFIPNPFDDTSPRLYKTGDIVRWLPEGQLIFIGRADNQVKIRGFRIELGEVEALLKNHPQILQAVVAVQEDETAEKFLVAYYVGASQLSEASLRKYLAASLPSYMAPAYFKPMKQLPLTVNGKINRRALPALDAVRADKGNDFVAPGTQMEVMLASLWSEVLRLEKIGIHDNFLELGGHSLTAIRLASRINEAFELELSPNLIFKQPTIASLAAALEEELERLLADLDE